MITGWIILPAVFILYLLASIKILREYERGVVFQLGRVLTQAKGPGVVLVFAPNPSAESLPENRNGGAGV